MRLDVVRGGRSGGICFVVLLLLLLCSVSPRLGGVGFSNVSMLLLFIRVTIFKLLDKIGFLISINIYFYFYSAQDIKMRENKTIFSFF
jgi:hypothetical protein